MKPILSPAGLPVKDGFVVIDARGHRCPVPTLKLRRQMEQADNQIGVILWANDPMAQIDVPHFCNQNNYVLLSTEAVDEDWVFTIARAGR
ncbi:sulfurtransferase TusA family protein [Asticcacaulis sp.]|uniref:sulfurtransferase TusA family protein n=1 Tax=Asticcacaulis sp. TaxID=1872648 RepID=UPI002CEE8908|nr:sulfurtransferase TusA family protein [Asticcacaulis sp.]HTM82357.1 sulfurtransferase TusA family protein [Asticcacaulis sp.]